MYDHDHEIDYSAAARELDALDEAAVARLRAFIAALEAALSREGLMKYEVPPRFRALREVLSEYDRRQTRH
jgi:predicted component of type VI protein secretion system